MVDVGGYLDHGNQDIRELTEKLIVNITDKVGVKEVVEIL